LVWLALAAGAIPALAQSTLSLRVLWGEKSPASALYRIDLKAAEGLTVAAATPYSLEPGESLEHSRAGAGDVDGVTVKLSFDERRGARRQDLHILWSDLIQAADADTAQRLAFDAAMAPDSPKLTVSLDEQRSRGFSVTIDQLLREKSVWIPDLHVFLTVADPPVSLDQHLADIKAAHGKRILQQVETGPEASYEQFAALWEDMGDPGYQNPEQRGPGHIVGLSWDGSLRKFGVDRGAGVWNDYGNPDKFQFWFSFADIAKGLPGWKQQKLVDGLPIIRTKLELDGVAYEIEQFAYPLAGPPQERRGDIDMLLLQKVTLTNLTPSPRSVPLSMAHRRQLSREFTTDFGADYQDGLLVVREEAHHGTLFSVQGDFQGPWWNGVADYQREMRRVDAGVVVELPARASRELIVKLASPAVAPEDRRRLVELSYESARRGTIAFWEGYLSRGAQFEAPDPAVNELFRASLWHALRLPRRHGGEGPGTRIDLPYSNFAYGQSGTPWPINHAVYADYMIYGLRGYSAIATEELLAQFRNNQESSGRVNGYAHWLSYTPAMLYAAGRNFLLTQDRRAFEQLLPQALRAMEWCLDQAERAAQHDGPAAGLIEGPLNDGTAEGYWAFNQAYMYAGLRVFAQALESIGHGAAARCRRGADSLQTAIEKGFREATINAPIVQLRDRTWIPYVPSEARSPRRLLDDWYPTDVDTGPLHLVRLEALPAGSDLAWWMLNDHEDNLFYKGWGAANEPVYNQQCTAYLLRDMPEAAIRCFYSHMASAFSHSTFEPVEHRWTHGQYFGPPSTDGSWFELYRLMLIRETADDTLLLGQAAPRRWLADGERILVRNAPTYYGPLSMTIESRANEGSITAAIELGEKRPGTLKLRLRHPASKPISSVRVNGSRWDDFDPQREWVSIVKPEAQRYRIEVSY
jgi:hypothetical protein